MHPVFEHTKARSGKHVPCNDGRTLCLVLYGGSMSGVIGAGAMIALQELGLSHAFDHIICHSAGLPNASYLLADDTHRGTTIYLEDCVSSKFINFWRFWKVVDIDYLVNVMRDTKPLAVHTLLKSETQIHVELYNTGKKQEEYLRADRLTPDEYLDLLHGATAIHFLHPGASIIRGKRYMDIRSNQRVQHGEYAKKLGCSDTLVIYNRPDQPDPKRMPDESVVEIIPDKEWAVGGYVRDPDRLRKAAQEMGRKVKRAFGIDEAINL